MLNPNMEAIWLVIELTPGVQFSHSRRIPCDLRGKSCCTVLYSCNRMTCRARSCERRTARAISQTDAGLQRESGGSEAPPVALVQRKEYFIVLRRGGLLLVMFVRRELLGLAESEREELLATTLAWLAWLEDEIRIDCFRIHLL